MLFLVNFSLSVLVGRVEICDVLDVVLMVCLVGGGAETRGKIWKIYDFVLGYFGQLLHDFNKMAILELEPTAIADHDDRGVELADLIHQEILEELEYFIGFVGIQGLILLILGLLTFKKVHIFLERSQPQGEDEQIFIGVLVSNIEFILNIFEVIFAVVQQEILVIVFIVELLGFTIAICMGRLRFHLAFLEVVHEFFVESFLVSDVVFLFGVDVLFGEGYIHQVAAEAACKLEVELTFVAV